MSRELFSTDRSTVGLVAEPIELGGTGSLTAHGARQSLNMVGTADLDAVAGVAQLDTNSLVKLTNIPNVNIDPANAVDAALNVYTGQVCHFSITNYDSNRQYTLTAISGTASLMSYDDFNQCMLNHGDNGNKELPGGITACVAPGTIIFTAPTTPGLSGIILNGVTYEVNVLQAFVEKPIITTPVNNGVWGVKDLIVSIQQPFVIGHQDAVFTWEIEYQLAEDAAFTINLRTVTNANLIATFSNVTPNKLYYTRSRVSVPNEYSASEWSNTVSFATNPKLYPINEIQILTAPDGVDGDEFGSRLALSQDGQMLVVGCDNQIYGDPGIGSNSIYIYEKVNNIFELQDQFNYSGTQRIAYGVRQILLSSDKTTIAFTGTNGPNNNSNYLDVIETLYVYKKINNIWTFSASTILPSTGGYNGYQISANDDLSKIVAVQQPMSISLVPYLGIRVFVFAFSNNTLNQTALIEPTSHNLTDYVGYGSFLTPVVLDSIGERLAIGFLADGTNQKGCVFIYDYVNDTWNQTAVIYSDLPSPVANTYFGHAISLSKNGDTLFVGGMYDNIDRVFIFKFIGGNWVKQIDFVPNNWTASDGNMENIATTSDGSVFLIPTKSTTINANSDGSGFVDLFENVSNSVTQLHRYFATDDDAVSFYGATVALSENLDTVVIGAPGKDLNGNLEGAYHGCVYIYG